MRGVGQHTPPPAIDMQRCPEDNTSSYVEQQIKCYLKYGLIIHTECAREIATWFQSSGYSGKTFTQFAIMGYITNGLLDAIRHEMHDRAFLNPMWPDKPVENLCALIALQAYILKVYNVDASAIGAGVRYVVQDVKLACNCRCMQGKDCGGCGHIGCGFSNTAFKIRNPEAVD